MGDVQPQTESSKDFVMSRVLDAPRLRVWQALTEVERMKQWWHPSGFTVIAANMDFRPGGFFHCGMSSFEGYKMWGKFVYREIAPPERLVFVNTFSNAAGEITRHPILPIWPKETLSTVTFEDEPGDKTKLTIRWAAHNASEAEQKLFDASHVSMRVGWTGTLEQLAAYLAKE